MPDRTCQICGKSPASFGLRRPGLLSSLPKDKRGTLWTCADPECRAAAMERRKAVLHER